MEHKCFEWLVLETNVKDRDGMTAAWNMLEMFCTSKDIVVGFVSNFSCAI
jgi:hypothetical protein